MKEISLMQKEFPLSYAMTTFPMGWLEYLWVVCLFLLFLYHVVYLRFKYYHMQKRLVKVTETSTRFSDIIGALTRH